MKTCTKCRVEKPQSEFFRAQHHKDGLTSRCKSCHQEGARQSEKKTNPRRWSRRTEYMTGYSRRYSRLTRYDLTQEDFDALVTAQKGVCAICKLPPSGKLGFCVDHDHVTGKVRALLCNTCNAGLGQFKDDPALVLEAAAYLQRHANV